MDMPEQFENVSVVCKANVYFDGKVISHTVLRGNEKKTLGVIYPGSYHFNTDAAERMDITAGTCRVKVAGQTQWQSYGTGSSFSISAKSSFAIEVEEGVAQYICSYLS